MIRDLFHWCRLLLWERRLRHARVYRRHIDAMVRAEVLRAQSDLEHCETMASRARMARVELRANRRLAGTAS